MSKSLNADAKLKFYSRSELKIGLQIKLKWNDANAKNTARDISTNGTKANRLLLWALTQTVDEDKEALVLQSSLSPSASRA